MVRTTKAIMRAAISSFLIMPVLILNITHALLVRTAWVHRLRPDGGLLGLCDGHFPNLRAVVTRPGQWGNTSPPHGLRQ